MWPPIAALVNHVVALTFTVNYHEQFTANQQSSSGGSMDSGLDRITTTIKREWLAKIIAGTKKIEYREIKPYWTTRLKSLTPPFELRLINGMMPPMPEVTVLIDKVTTNKRNKVYEFHIEKVLGFKHWDRRRQAPKG